MNRDQLHFQLNAIKIENRKPNRFRKQLPSLSFAFGCLFAFFSKTKKEGEREPPKTVSRIPIPTRIPLQDSKNVGNRQKS
jgi:hypothetical protein